MGSLGFVFLIISSFVFGILAIFRYPSIPYCLLAMTSLILLTPFTNAMSKIGLMIMVYVYWRIAYQIVVKREKEEKLTQNYRGE